ncbi:MAG TPA: sulfurtransferase TusA family protein [Chloroflexota bacterium]
MAHDEPLAALTADMTVDLGQAGCGDLTPLIRGRMRELTSGQVLEVISEEPAAHDGIPAWSRLTGNELIQVTREAERSRFFIRKK